MRVGRSPGRIVLDGDSAPSIPKKGAEPLPNFRLISIVAERLDAPRCQLYGGRPHCSPGDFVLDGDPAPPSPKRGRRPSPQFSAHVHCGQTAGCIKLPLGVEVGLSPGDFVTDGDPVPPPQKGAEPPIFSPCLLWSNGCMDQDADWYGGRRRPAGHCVTWGPSFPP